MKIWFQHAFFQGEMNKRLALELLQKVSNPSHMFTDLEADEDGAVPNVPQRIASRHTSKPNSRGLMSQLDSDGKFCRFSYPKFFPRKLFPQLKLILLSLL